MQLKLVFALLIGLFYYNWKLGILRSEEYRYGESNPGLQDENLLS